MEVDGRIALAIECMLTAAACEAAARGTGIQGWADMAQAERRQATGLLADYLGDRSLGGRRFAARRG